ncbi:MAG: acyl-CoA thioesterase [Anaerolineae bacterium]|nr:acyl-CoA thioesterase [Anaerolineae bacterium]
MPNLVETTFHVRYAETDQMGIVHHAAYVVWLEEGRSQWLRAHGSSYALFEKAGLRLAVSEVHIRYRQPAYYDQQVTIRCWLKAMRSRQVKFGYQVVDPKTATILAEAYTTLISLDRQGNVTKMPTEWQIFFKESMSSSPTDKD